jgi:peptidoglycan/xylan/chitin deacetylase (PgdA/CDA1 family)
MSDSLVLCYHGVSEDWPADISITPKRLAGQVSWFVQRGYRPTTFTAAVSGRSAGKVLAVTFDDAYRSVARLAFPLLSELGVPATVFAPTEYVGDPEPRGWAGTELWVASPWASEILVMDWSELAGLAAAGWEIGSHTCSHPRLPELGDRELAHELRDSRTLLEDRLGRPCSSLAYPYGAVNRRVVRASKAVGYRAAGALLPGRVSPSDPLRFPRVYVGQEWADETLRRRARPAYRRLQGSVLWPLIPPLVRAARRISSVGHA